MSYNSDLQSYNIKIQNLIDKANNLPDKESADPVLQTKTVTPSTSKQTITADSGYDGLETVTVNAMPTATQATPSINISPTGTITATATQTAGYVSSGTKSSTKQLSTQPPTTFIPTTTDQIIGVGLYTIGPQTIKGDENLVAENIVAGKSIFGVDGTASVGGVELPTLTNPATEEEIFLNKETIAVDGSKLVGTFTLDSELTTQDNLISQIQNAVNNLPEATFTLQSKTVTPTDSEQIITADSDYDGLSQVVIEGDENLIPENIVSGVSIFGVEGNASAGSSGSSTTLTIQSMNGATAFYFTDNGTSGTISNAGTFILRGGNLIIPSNMHTISLRSGNCYRHDVYPYIYCFTSDSVIDIIISGSGA